MWCGGQLLVQKQLEQAKLDAIEVELAAMQLIIGEMKQGNTKTKLKKTDSDESSTVIEVHPVPAECAQHDFWQWGSG